MSYTQREIKIIEVIAYRLYQKRIRNGWNGTKEEDWKLAELEYMRRKANGNA
jgi:hypothetical protein